MPYVNNRWLGGTLTNFHTIKQSLERLPDDYLQPHRDKQGRCPRCGGPNATRKAAGRTSYYCPRCQRAPG